MREFSLSGRRAVVVGIATLGLVAGGATLVVAVGSDAEHPRGQEAAGPRIFGQGAGGECRMGYDTASTTNTPPDDSTADNPPANTVTIRKVCPGPMVATWTGEVVADQAGEFIHMDLRATCTGIGGLNNPCIVGAQVYASPGHTFLQNGVGPHGTRSMGGVWSGLKRGVWKVEALPGGNGAANVQFSTLIVEAFQQS